MRGTSPIPTSFSAVRIVLLVVATATIVVTAGLALGIDTPSWTNSGEPAINETGLASLETQQPRCGTRRSSNSTTTSHPADGGRRMTFNQTVPVAARDSELTAGFEEVSENRYLLALQRTAGNRSTDCYLEMRFEATVDVAQQDDFTLIVTVDGTRIQRLVSEPGGSGVGSTNGDPRPPSMSDAEWEAALNASDEYFYNGSRGHDSGSSSASDGDESDDAAGGSSDSGSLAS